MMPITSKECTLLLVTGSSPLTEGGAPWEEQRPRGLWGSTNAGRSSPPS
jgi:hypothetical protein